MKGGVTILTILYSEWEKKEEEYPLLNILQHNTKHEIVHML